MADPKKITVLRRFCNHAAATVFLVVGVCLQTGEYVLTTACVMVMGTYGDGLEKRHGESPLLPKNNGDTETRVRIQVA